MSIEAALLQRSGSQCEFCSSPEDLSVFPVPPRDDSSADNCMVICKRCRDQVENLEQVDVNHWRCLSGSIWSEFPAVQVMSWRMLQQLQGESWAQDLLGQLYLDDETRQWAEAMQESQSSSIVTKDSNGTALSNGDSVTLIKDLDVKGANFTAKRGTMVRNISLTDDPKYIEGKINGTQIVLVAAYLKKA